MLPCGRELARHAGLGSGARYPVAMSSSSAFYRKLRRTLPAPLRHSTPYYAYYAYYAFYALFLMPHIGFLDNLPAIFELIEKQIVGEEQLCTVFDKPDLCHGSVACNINHVILNGDFAVGYIT